MLNAGCMNKAKENSSMSVCVQVLILVIFRKYFLDYQVNTIQTSFAMGFIIDIRNICVNIPMEYGKTFSTYLAENVALSLLLPKKYSSKSRHCSS